LSGGLEALFGGLTIQFGGLRRQRSGGRAQPKAFFAERLAGRRLGQALKYLGRKKDPSPPLLGIVHPEHAESGPVFDGGAGSRHRDIQALRERNRFNSGILIHQASSLCIDSRHRSFEQGPRIGTFGNEPMRDLG